LAKNIVRVTQRAHTSFKKDTGMTVVSKVRLAVVSELIPYQKHKHRKTERMEKKEYN